MLGLKLPTDPRWANIAEKNIDEILTDHAWCEQKAASNAISITIRYPDRSELVTELLILAQEELTHFQMVHERILARGLELGKPRKDEYVRQLMAYFPQGGKPLASRLADNRPSTDAHTHISAVFPAPATGPDDPPSPHAMDVTPFAPLSPCRLPIPTLRVDG